MMQKNRWGILMLVAALLASCNSVEKDQDGNPVSAVTIGNQVWMNQNLNVATFSNGDPIPEVQTEAEWVHAGESGQPAWCYFNNDPSHGAEFGRLYNWYAATDPRGLAPEGWRIPTDDDWNELIVAVGGALSAGTVLKSQTGWSDNGNGSDDFGMNLLPAGGRGGMSGFNGAGRVAVFWSQTSKSRSFALYRVAHTHRTGLFQENDDKMSGFSIRCVKDY